MTGIEQAVEALAQGRMIIITGDRLRGGFAKTAEKVAVPQRPVVDILTEGCGRAVAGYQ